MNSVPDYGLMKYEAASTVVEIETEEDFKRAGEVLVRIATYTKKLLKGDPETEWPGWEKLISAAHQSYRLVSDSRTRHMSRWVKVREAYEKAMQTFREKQDKQIAMLTTEMQKTALRNRAQIEGKISVAMKAGRMAEVQSLQAQLQMIPLNPAPLVADHKLPGIAQGEEYEVTITNLMELVKAVAEGRVPLMGIVQQKEYPLFDVRESVIRAARSSMGEAFDWPGVEIKTKTSYRPRAVSE